MRGERSVMGSWTGVIVIALFWIMLSLAVAVDSLVLDAMRHALPPKPGRRGDNAKARESHE